MCRPQPATSILQSEWRCCPRKERSKRPCDIRSCRSSSAVHDNATVCACLASVSSKQRRLCAAFAIPRGNHSIRPCDVGVCPRQSNGACKIGKCSCQPQLTPSNGDCVLRCCSPQGAQQRSCGAASCRRQFSSACKCRHLCLCQPQPVVSNADKGCVNTSRQQPTRMRACLGANAIKEHILPASADQRTHTWCKCNPKNSFLVQVRTRQHSVTAAQPKELILGANPTQEHRVRANATKDHSHGADAGS